VELTAFLPEPETEQEYILTDRLGQGPGSRIWFIHLPGGFAKDPEVGSDRLKASLKQSQLFSSVSNGREWLSPSQIPREIFDNRYALIDADFSESGFSYAVNARIPDILLSVDSELDQLIFADPYLATLEIIDNYFSFADRESQQWLPEDGGAYLVVETNAPSFDIDAQSLVLNTINQNARRLFNVVPEVHGVGYYGVSLQSVVRSEVAYRSTLASLLLIAVLLFMYRNVFFVAAGALPVLVGVLTGLALLTLLFDRIHGITLAFGFTIIGVVIDYPLHVISQIRRGAPVAQILPTLRLSAASTVLAFLTIALSGTAGLAQLGVFSAVGVFTALLVSITLLPALFGQAPKSEPVSNADGDVVLTLWPAILLMAIGGSWLLLQDKEVWVDDLSELTPVQPEILQRDAELRASFGAPNIRYLIVFTNSSLDQVLLSTEALVAAVRTSISESPLTSIQAVTDLVPSAARQEARLKAAGALTSQQIERSALDAGLQAKTFLPFSVYLAAAAAERRLVTPTTYEGTQLEGGVDSLLYQRRGKWYSIVTFRSEGDAATVLDWLDKQSLDLVLVDLKQASESLVGGYRNQLLITLGAALLIIIAVVRIHTRCWSRTTWIFGTLLASSVTTVAVIVFLSGSVSLFGLVSLVLVAGLGLDYALFLSDKEAEVSTLAASRHAVIASALSTGSAFGVLALSSIPVLSGIGATVFWGVLITFLAAWTGSRRLTFSKL